MIESRILLVIEALKGKSIELVEPASMGHGVLIDYRDIIFKFFNNKKSLLGLRFDLIYLLKTHKIISNDIF